MDRALLLIIAAMIYILWPYDIVPDFIAIVGWIDDLIVGLAAVYFALKTLQGRTRTGPRRRRSKPSAQRPHFEEPRANGGTVSENPYEVLGLKPGVTVEELKNAYRREIAKYHPDKVHHLGTEFRKLADAKAKAIHKAYKTLLKRLEDFG